MPSLPRSVRILVRDPGLTAVSVVALTLGIGLTTTTFSILQGTVLRGLPFEDSHQLVFISRSRPSIESTRYKATLRDLLSWRERQNSFAGLAGFLRISLSLSGHDARPELRSGAAVTSDLFGLLRTQPVLGRTFSEEENRPGTAPVMIISHDLWKTSFAGDTGVLGRRVRVDGTARRIIGVMPAGFGFPGFEDIWLPLQYEPDSIALSGGGNVDVVGRLREGVSVGAAQTELANIARQLEREYPETNEGVRVHVEPYIETLVGREISALAWTMLGAVFGVLLIACSNVATLLLARAAAREREMAVRSALGAGRTRIIAHLLSETLSLATLGGVLGVAFARLGILLFNSSMEANFSPVPFWVDIRLDRTVLMFLLWLIGTATLLAGTVPAVQASGTRANVVLQDASRGTSSLRLGRVSRVLVVLEIALSCGLLIPAALLTRSAVRVADMDVGFATEDVLTARITLNSRDYSDGGRRTRFYDDILARLEGGQGVRAAALTSALPGLVAAGAPMGLEGVPYESERDYPTVRWAAVTPGFFETFGVSLSEGRTFEPYDDVGSLRVAIVNRSFVNSYMQGMDPLGRRLRFGRSTDSPVWRTIVGVVPDMMMNRRRGGGRIEESPEGIYLPLAQATTRFPLIALRSVGDPLTYTSMVRAEIAGIDPNVPLSDVDTMAGAINDANWIYRMLGVLFGAFGVAALFLASVGLYGVMAFSVGRRRGEIGVRRALGARGGDVLALVIAQGLRRLAVGLALGLAFAAVSARVLATQLFQVEPNDPLVFAGVVLVLAVTGLVACLVPALRATQVDPMDALRIE